MVKGVNKTIIEINDTGNKMFEKVILYVTPKYGNMSNKKLLSEAEQLIDKYSPYDSRPIVNRASRTNKRALIMLLFAGILAAAAVVCLIVK